jgi:ADP-heptose:LPS heptosyltransferase
VSLHRFSHRNVLNPNNLPTAAVVRYGAFGDTVQAMSVVTQLKKDGYHVTFICQHPGSELVMHDPSIDRLIVQTQNQVPIGQLGQFWSWFEMRGAPGGKRFDKWINLTESVESNLLISAGNVKFVWAPKARHQFMNINYLEFQHKIGNVPYVPTFKFYPTEQEIRWRNEERSRMKKHGIEKFILWALAGSSRTHKIYPHSDAIWAHIVKYYPGWGILAVGDPSCVELEKKHEALGTPRLWLTSTRYSMRQVLLMLEIADVVVGPETGTMSAAAFYPMPKVLFLSHSTVENLSRDWVNTTSLYAPKTHCPGRGANEAPACHKMLPTFEGCRRHEQSGVAQCATEIKPEWTWDVLQKCMNTGVAPQWEPPNDPE